MNAMLKVMGTACLIFFVLASGELAAQNSLGVVVRADQWTINSGHLASPQTRPGIAVGLASWGSTGVARAVVGWVSEGNVRPGWMTVGVEGGPRLLVADRLGVGVQLNVAGLDMKAENRREAFRDCRPEDFCLVEAPSYRNGWGLLAGGSLVGSMVPWDRLELTGEYGWNRIWAGANDEEVLRKWSLGAQLRIR